MTSLARAVSRATDRFGARSHEPRDDYAFCPEDRFWFRPDYTEGKCPLCGWVAPGGASPSPLVRRMDRSWFGVGLLALESLGMMALVLFMYFRA